MVYPGAGIPNSLGNAWTTSYSTTGTGNVVLDTGANISVTSLSSVNTIVGNITGSASTVTGNAQPAITSVGVLTDLTVTGNLSLGAALGDGMLVGNTYPWHDLLGAITPSSHGTTAPVFKTFEGVIRGWAYGVGDRGDITYHLPHDYAPGTDLLIHLHWGHNGANIVGNLSATISASYADRATPMSFTTPVAVPIGATGVTIANTPQYRHRVDEVPLSSPGGSATTLNTNQIGVDGLININYVFTEIPAIAGSPTSTNLPFLWQIDIHYQSTNIGTKNNAPNFYP
jgi:hypothetical protein